jgi:EmrB/QacA subfamily drug resistance transporter
VTATAEPVTGAGAPLSRKQILTVFSGLMAGMLLSALDSNIMSTAIPTIVGELGGLESVAWVGTAYILTSTTVTPLYGKLSDLYGRRLLFQAAIVLFILGSIGAGLAQSMLHLVMARGLQGLGGGGLMSMAFVIIGDVVPARERGRYVGLFTSVFAFSAVAGPLVGGFFVDTLDWRWIFWINVPLGAAALVITSSALRLPFARQERSIDYPGVVLLTGAVSTLVLMTTWGGTEYEWGSPTIVGLGVASVVLTVVFLLVERRAEEPLLPLRLFSNSVFSVTSAIGLALGTIMFGASYFLPLYLQVVTGASATSSGLLLVPLMIGVTVSSIVIGRLTTRTGRYKVFPIIGLGVGCIGIGLLTQLGTDTTRAYTSASMLVLGTGMGMALPTISLAVQNSVDWRDLGIATSLVTFFRSLGGAIGLAVFGAIFTSTLRNELPDRLPPGTTVDTDRLLNSPKDIQALEPALRDGVVASIADAVASIYVVALPLVIVAFVLAWFVKELPLRETSALQDSVGESSLPGHGV